MSVRAPNPEQQAAIDEAGVVFVSAGAGTGKTTVLVERFVRAVADRGLGLESVLVITYTERAAGELRARIRERLVELGRVDLARDIERAWISTIHGFCNRLLKSHPFEAGLDPGFRVLDESQSRVLRSEAFTEALARFCAGREPDRLELLATYGSRRLSIMLGGVYERLRSAGRALELGVADESSLAEALDALAECARALPGNPQAERALALATGPAPRADELLDLEDLRPTEKIPALTGLKDALATVESAALDEMASRDRELLEELLRGFDAAYREAKARESGVDFEDLQLYARDLLLSSEEVREKAAVALPVACSWTSSRTRTGSSASWSTRSTPRSSSSSGTSSSRSTASGTRTSRSSASAAPRATASSRSRRTTARARRSSGSSTTCSGRSSAPTTSRSWRRGGSPSWPGPGSSCSSPTRRRTRAARPHWREAESKHVARRVKELVDTGEATPGEIVLLFAAGHRRRALRGGAARGGPADLPRGRARLLRPAAGRGSHRVPAAPPEPLRRRGARDRARLAVRRRLERRARRCCAARPGAGRSSPGSSASFRAGSPSGTRGSTRRSASATTGLYARPSGSGSSGCASRSSSSTTTTSPSSRSGTAAAATRISASSAAWPARTSRCAARTSRASSASCATRRRPGRVRSRRPRRRRAATRCGSSPSTRRRGSSSRWSSSRMPAASRHRPRRTRSSACPTGASGSASSIPPRASARARSGGTTCARRSRPPTRPRTGGSSTWP